MKQYVLYVKSYIVDNFNLKLYASTTLLLVVCLVANYSVEFEDTVMDTYYGSEIQKIYYLLFQGIPYYVVCLFIYLFTDNKSFVKNSKFWLYSLFGLSVLSFDRSFYYHHNFNDLHYFTIKLIGSSREMLTMFLPLLFFYLFYDRRKITHFYGLRLKGVDFRPYVWMLAGMSILVVLASFNQSFLDHYPVYKTRLGEAYARVHEISKYIPFVSFELAYGLSFTMIELLFRGFLVIGLARFLGDDVILPMAVTYCVLHFGKPAGEAISSIFGAYILGILALRTKNIWGGVFIHAGIAVSMDVFAYLQK